MGIVEILMLPNAQLTFHLSNVGRMNLEAVDLFHIGFDVAHGGNEAKVDIELHRIHGYLQVVCYFFPPKQTTVSTWAHLGNRSAA